MIDAVRAADHRSRMTLSTQYAQAATAQVAIEAAFEDMAVKHDILTKLEACPSSGCRDGHQYILFGCE
jgi:3-hydroxyacyl-CoA dehydrogenase